MGDVNPKLRHTAASEAFTLRSAAPEDAAALLDYVRAVTEEVGYFMAQRHELPATVELERQWIETHRDQPGQLLMVAEADGAIVGSLSFACGGLERIAHTGTFGISVRYDWRGRGVGRALIQTLLDWADANPAIEKVCLSVLAANTRAIALYRRFGFVEEGRRSRQIKLGPEQYVDELLMGRFVRQSLGNT